MDRMLMGVVFVPDLVLHQIAALVVFLHMIRLPTHPLSFGMSHWSHWSVCHPKFQILQKTLFLKLKIVTSISRQIR